MTSQDAAYVFGTAAGTYQYKFIVDSEWRFAPDQSTVRDEMGNINNCITVEDQQMCALFVIIASLIVCPCKQKETVPLTSLRYLHEDPCSGFFSDNPNNAYTQVPFRIMHAFPCTSVHLLL